MEQKSRFRSSLLLAASATLCGTLLSGPASAHTETALSAFAAINQTGGMPWTVDGFGLAASARWNHWVADASFRHQPGKGNHTGYAQKYHFSVLQEDFNARLGYVVLANRWLSVYPFAAYNYLSYGDLRDNGVGGGIGATIRLFRWVRLYGHAEALRGFDGNIGGLNLTRSSNLFQFKGGASIPIAHRWSVFSSLEYFRYVGAGNALHGYTVEAGATRTFG